MFEIRKMLRKGKKKQGIVIFPLYGCHEKYKEKILKENSKGNKVLFSLILL